jgi:predicted dehydrogenase
VGDPVRIGLVGYGLGGRAFHAPLITSAPDLELVGAVTTDAGRVTQLAEDHPEVPAVGDIHDLLELGARAVAISSTTGTHAELAHTALDLGLHVVVDKPLAVDSASAREVVAHAERAGLLVTAYQNRRWDSDFLTVRRLLHEQVLGEVFRFESRFERWAPGPPRAAWRSSLTPAEGGGLRLDLVTHLADQAHVLFGPVASVYAESAIHRPGARAEDDITVLLTHENGVSTHLHASSWAGDTSRRFRVLGTEGAYVIGGIDGQEHALRSGRTPEREGDRWGVEPIETWGHVHRGDEHEVVPTERGRWDTFYPAFAAAVRGDGPLPVDPYDAIEVLRVLDAAAISAAEHRVVRLDEIG